MRTRAFMTTDLDDQRFGSAYDPVLNGVAQGLARLFPPVELDRRNAADETAPWQDAGEPDDGDQLLDP